MPEIIKTAYIIYDNEAKGCFQCIRAKLMARGYAVLSKVTLKIDELALLAIESSELEIDYQEQITKIEQHKIDISDEVLVIDNGHQMDDHSVDLMYYAIDHNKPVHITGQGIPNNYLSLCNET